MSGFRRTLTRGIRGSFDPVEITLLRQVMKDLVELLSSPQEGHEDPLAAAIGISSNDRLPEDPALARLLPDAYGNPEHAAEFRRYTEHGLRESKRARAQAVLDDLGEGDRPRSISLDDQRAEIWAMAINDLRLALGSRLEVDADAEEKFQSLADDDPRKSAYAVFAWLGWLQETLIEALVS
jgi:hypothetical protein